MTYRILIIEDDITLNQLLAASLQQRGFVTTSAAGGRPGLELAGRERPHLILLDLMMPQLDGWTVCRQLREVSDVPIIMLTAKGSEDDIIAGFELGADDYIVKPFSIRELEQRILAVLRRASGRGQTAPSGYDDGRLHIDFDRGLVRRCGQVVNLTPTEYRLLRCLVERRGRVIPHEEILRTVWGEAYSDATSSLSLYIRYLREKLEDDPRKPRYLHTKWGIGYWFEPATPAPLRYAMIRPPGALRNHKESS